MSETRVPAIPAPTDSNLRDVARAVKNVLDVREGLLGDPLDANVTFRDLKEGGIIDVSTVRRGGGSGTVLVTPPSAGGGTAYDPTTDLTTPPAPTGFTATGLFAAVKLSWAVPTSMRNYAYTEIWRSTTNVQGTAVRIGSSVVPAYTDYIGSGATQYYWVRIVSQANVTGPYNSSAGTVGAAAPDPAYLLDVLTGEVTESQLFTSLGERIDQIDKPTTGLVTQVSQLNGQYTVKIDNNGYVSGFGLASTPTTGTPFSQFIVRADRFSISSPSGPGVPAATPFVVQTTAGVAPNGAAIPVGVYMDGAFIKTATITKAQIGSIYADRIEAGFTSSVDIESAKFYGSEFYIGGAVTYEFNDTQRPDQKTGIAQVSNYNIALRPTGAEFDVGYFKIKNGATLTTPFEVVNNVVRITRAAIGTITANEIDSRNLTIKDANGNVVFSAEGGLGAENLDATSGGVNLLVNSTFRSKFNNPNNANDPDNRRPLNYAAYNSSGVAREWIDTAGFADSSAFGLRCKGWTVGQFGLYTTSVIQEGGLSGGVFGGWKPNTTYIVSLRAKVVRATLVFSLLQTAVTATATQLVLQDASQFPAPGTVGGSYFVFFTDGAESTWEGMLVTGKVGNTLTVVRAQSGTTIARGVGARVQIGFTNLRFGWNTSPEALTDIANPVLSTGWQLYTFRLRWGAAVEPSGALYLTLFGTKRADEEIHIDELQVQEGDVPSAWGPSERDMVGTLNPITANNISSYVGADAIGITQLGTTLQTTNFSATAGWQIKKDGTATFNSVKVRGEINGGAYTGYAWPASGTGFHLGPGGLLLGNFNIPDPGVGPPAPRRYFQVDASGDVYAPGFSIVNGNATFSGTLSAGIVNTTQIVGAAVSSGYAVSAGSAAASCSVTVVAPVDTSSVVLLGYCGTPFIALGGSGKDSFSYTAIPLGTVSVQRIANENGAQVFEPVQPVTTQSQHVIFSINAPTAGTYVVTLTRDVASGPMNLAVIVNKR